MPDPSRVDPDGLLEYSVVFTERSLNHMSAKFQQAMRDLSGMLRHTYGAASVAVVPGGGTYGMEAIARQFAPGRRCLVIRNGYFSYRWSQILETAGLTDDVTVLKATPEGPDPMSPWSPPPAESVVAAIRELRPELVLAPHVDTSSGILLPPDYLRAVGRATREAGGLFVLDCVASGAVYVDMRDAAVDVLLTAPQKGWSSSPGAALVMLSEEAGDRLGETRSSSFACDLRRWREIMEAYEAGGHAYHATLPTDALIGLRDAMRETIDAGLDEMERRQWELGRRVRASLAAHGYPSVAAPGFEAPSVVVSHTDDPLVRSGKRFADAGLQVAGGVPLMCDEPPGFSSFRIGLFGLDKWRDPDGTAERLEAALRRIEAARAADG